MSTEKEGSALDALRKYPCDSLIERRLREAILEVADRAQPLAEMVDRGLFPTLNADDRAELRTAAYPILLASRTAAAHVQALAQSKPPSSIWQGAVISAVSALSAIASGVCLIGATLALVASTDDEPTVKPATSAPPTAPPDPPAPADGAAAAPHTESTKET